MDALLAEEVKRCGPESGRYWERINVLARGYGQLVPRDRRLILKQPIVVCCPRMSDDLKSPRCLRPKGASMTCGIILYEAQVCTGRTPTEPRHERRLEGYYE
jgi:hypothetical protein